MRSEAATFCSGFAFEIYNFEQLRYDRAYQSSAHRGASRLLDQKLPGSQQLVADKDAGDPFEALIALLCRHCGEVAHELEQLLPAIEIDPMVSTRLDMGFGRFRDVRYRARNAFRHDQAFSMSGGELQLCGYFDPFLAPEKLQLALK
jgi:hypothetical protein